MDIKYKVNGLLEIIFGCLSDTINSITSFFDYILIDKALVVVCLLFIIFVMSILITVYLWEKSKEKETSRSQKIQFFKSFILMVLSFVVIIFSYIGISDFYINSNLITETDEVVLVENGAKNIRISEDGYTSFATGGVKFVGKRGYSVTYFKGRPSFNQASFNNNHLKETIVNIDNDVYSNLNLDKDTKKIRLKYYFYKKGSRTPRMIVVESE
jgi:hypothetical protein